jgi:phosphatidylglycerophosphate synthase
MLATVPDDVRLNQSYAHLLARVLVRPLLGTWVRPNHLTVLRLAAGLTACALLTDASAAALLWSGVLWFAACLLDRADGELARLGDLRSDSGKALDFFSDLLLDSLWFLGVGIGLQHGALGGVALALGVLTFLAMLVCMLLSEWYERRAGPGVKTFYGLKRFHPDDALFLLAVFTWCNWLAPILIAASVCTPIIALVVVVRCAALKRRSPVTAAHDLAASSK